ncbi:MAG: substrate-binding domain-containing protein [Chitinophagaceae bacterium]|nr:substrate-binding domain-containing protein [Chitinophagaceae bacterium]
MNSEKYRQIIVNGFGILIIALLISGCRSNKAAPSDTVNSGTIYISVDESFKPVIEEQIRVFERSFPDAHIIAEYKTEADCFKDLYTDSLKRMIIVTRGLRNEEDDYFREKYNYPPAWDNMANDAITLIVNSKSTDTLFTLERLRDQLSGKINRDQKLFSTG